jgi:hypothetical protein
MAGFQLEKHGNEGKGRSRAMLCRKVACAYLCVSLLSLVDAKGQFLCL